MKRTAGILIAITAMLLGGGASVHGASIVDSKHNLSISGPGTVKASGESRVCVFCHTPHNARQDIPYLWNRAAQSTIYAPYASSTLAATVGQPTGASRLCLSCHDGTIALGAVLSEPTAIAFSGAVTLSGRSTSLATDLSDDHPVSFDYRSSITAGNLELVEASALSSSPVQLDAAGQLQCTACHDPHDNEYGKFLVMTNQGSALCIECHVKDEWPVSTHATSAAVWSGTGVDPWPDSDYATVAENGCGNCHRPHTAATHQRLLRWGNEEDNCLVCHGGEVATASDIAADLTKIYRHPVADFLGVHDAAEDFKDPGGVSRHVECADCHNPHQVNGATAVAPYVSGRNIGVQGIDGAGAGITSALNLYEICFKCHADTPNNVIPTPAVTRQISQVNTRLEFSDGNPSSHPVVRTTDSPAVPSLLPPYTSGGFIYCTDCHGSDDPAAGAAGPHGSMNEHLLVANYSTADRQAESADAYALCYRCHSRTVILSPHGGFPQHQKHIRDTSCATCHDPHGISATQGNFTNNRRLINFNIDVVSPSSDGQLYYDGDGMRPTCVLICHQHEHKERGQG